MSKASKLVAILLIAVVVAAGAGYWLFSPNLTSGNAGHTSEGTSLEVNRRTLEQTPITSISSPTTAVVETSLLLNVTATKPVSYYISLLKSTGVQPYVELGWELQALPEVTNATAVAKIAYLALNATNPEVREAFQLMTKGGTPVASEFKYTVPNYNTELQVLYWLALRNDFKRDDTLALAIAMVNGLWVTVGDSQVKEAVKEDTNDLLVFMRETNQLQSEREYYELEGYPLEAKITLAWTANMATTAGHYGLTDYRERRLPLKGYQYDTVSTKTLQAMRQFADRMGWFKDKVDANVGSVERYLYFGRAEHWNYTCTQEKQGKIDVEGESVDNCGIFNVDWQFEHYLREGSFVGGCADEASVASALLMSIGIANTVTSIRWGPTGYTGHFHVTYFEPKGQRWKIYQEQLGIDRNSGSGQNPVNVFYLFVPAVSEKGYTIWHDTREQNLWIWKSRAWYMLFPVTIDQINQMFTNGVPTSEVKQWLLYS